MISSEPGPGGSGAGSVADTAVLDGAAIDAVKLQEEIGLDVITDGEARRITWAQTPRFLDCFSAPRKRGRR